LERTFTQIDQNNFAELSRDFNPLHMDEVYARRAIFGKQVVHGIHLLLWSLNELSKHLSDKYIHISRLVCRFPKPVGLNEKVKINIHEIEEQGKIKMDIVDCSKGLVCTSIQVFFSNLKTTKNEWDVSLYETSTKRQPTYVSFNSEFSFNETQSLILGTLAPLKAFKDLSKKTPFWQILFIINSTRLVGMECPGLNSIFSSFEIDFDTQPKESKTVEYRVKKYFSKLSRLDMQMLWEGTKAELVTFVRPEAIETKSGEDIQNIVSAKKYKKVRALVVGGSRGIGAVTTKLLALSGSDVLFTYYKGEKEARHIESEINELGGNCRGINLDIDDIETPMQTIKDYQATHLFYFPTPSIFVGNKSQFNSDIYTKFSQYYVEAFYKVFSSLKDNLSFVFYPSSTAIDERVLEMKEYIMAKSAGEELCKFLAVIHPSINFYSRRIPRTETDQTVSLVKVKSEDPVNLMMAYMDEFLAVDSAIQIQNPKKITEGVPKSEASVI
jgi:acyl dehydratase